MNGTETIKMGNGTLWSRFEACVRDLCEFNFDAAETLKPETAQETKETIER